MSSKSESTSVTIDTVHESDQTLAIHYLFIKRVCFFVFVESDSETKVNLYLSWVGAPVFVTTVPKNLHKNLPLLFLTHYSSLFV